MEKKNLRKKKEKRRNFLIAVFLKTYMAILNLEPVKKNEAAVRSLNRNKIAT